MLYFLKISGIFIWPLMLMLLLVLVSIVRAATTIGGNADREVTARRLTAILFWGALSAVLGLLGQFSGLYKALGVISHATEISPAVVAMGFKESFSTSLFGFVTLVLASLAWVVLRSLDTRRHRA